MADYRIQKIYNKDGKLENYCVYRGEYECITETLAFTNYLKNVKRRTATTIQNKAIGLCYWYQYLDEIDQSADSFFTLQDQLTFIQKLENKTNYNKKKLVYVAGSNPYEKGLSAETIEIYIQGINEFYNYLCSNNMISLSATYLPFRKELEIRVKGKSKSSLPEILTLDEVRQITDACTSYRNKAIILTMVSTGLRVGELCSLTLRALDFKTHTIHLKKQYLDLETGVLKTGERELKGTAAMFAAIHKYMIFERSKVAKCDNLFVTLPSMNSKHAPGMPLTKGSVIQIFKNLKKKTGIHNCHAHILRHTFATNFLSMKEKNDKITIAMLQKLLGHKNISTTMIYTHLDYSLDDFSESKEFEELINNALMTTINR